MNKENERGNIRKNEHKRLNKTKAIKISLSLFVVIIFAILLAVSLQVIKTTKIGAKVLDNLSGDTTEDVWQIISVSDEEETAENTNDDGISTVDDSSDYTITVTEYTGDTLEAEYDYENGVVLIYFVDGVSLEQMSVTNVSSDEVELNQFYEEKTGYVLDELHLFRYISTSDSVEGYGSFSVDDSLTSTSTLAYSMSRYFGVWTIYHEGTAIAMRSWLYGEMAQTAWGVGVVVLDYQPINYTIAFDGNGADDGEMESIDATYDEEYTLTANTFTRDGYTFTGWNTEADGSGTSYEDGETVSNLTTTDGDTVTLYAQWEPIIYTIAFSGNDADKGEMDSISATYDEEYTLTTNKFTREGYKFTGWNTEADGSGTSFEDGATVSNLSTEDGATVTLYAQWELDTVSVNFTKLSSKTNEELEGVEFSLYELICEDSSHEHDTSEDLIDVNDYDTTCWELIDTYTTTTDGTFTLNDIVITGIYRLVETKTIDNYLLPTGQWKIELNYDDNLDEDKAITVNGVTLQITGISNPPAVTAGDDTIYIYNSSSYDIPTTGAMGIEDYITIGVIIILVGAVGKIHKSKRIVGLRSSRIKASRAETKNIKKISKMQKRCRKMQKKTEKMLKK